MPARFPGQVAVVTGAASGIGLAISQRLATEGVCVVLVDLAGTAVEQAADKLVASGAQALAVAADVTSRADIEHYVQAAVAAFGGIDFFFNTPASWDRSARSPSVRTNCSTAWWPLTSGQLGWA